MSATMFSDGSIPRRSFLRGAAISAAAVSAAGSWGTAAPAEVAVGVVGTGARGQAVLRSFLKVPGVRVAALCDVDGRRLQAAAELAAEHRPEKHSDYGALLRVSGLDAVILATPCHQHREQAIAVLQANRHLYLEKPVGITVRDVTEIETAARGAKVVLQVGQQLRYDPKRRRMAELVQGGALGKVAFMRASRMGRGYPPEKLWINITQYSGDVMVEQAVHNLDICNWMMGAHPVSAFGCGEQFLFEPQGKTVTDFYSVLLRYPEGRYVEFCQNNLSTPQTGGGADVVYGEEKSLNLGNGEISLRAARGADAAAPIPMEGMGEAVNTNDAAAVDFIRCIREGAAPFCDLEVGKIAALTALLVRKSIYERREVTWEQLLAEDAPLQRA